MDLSREYNRQTSLCPHELLTDAAQDEPGAAIGVTAGIKGLYKIEAVCSLTGKKRVLADWFSNVITNIGMDRAFNVQGNLAQYCVVGAGTNPAAATDTQLQTLVGSTTNVTASSQTAQSGAPYYTSSFKTYQFAPGVAAGNLSEIGIGWATNQLFSRALIKDPGGNPITITVLSTEYLNVVYEFRLYPQATDHVTNITTSSVTYAVTTRAAYINTATWDASVLLSQGFSTPPTTAGIYTGGIGPITGVNGGGYYGQGGTPSWVAPYVNGTYTRAGIINWSPTEANPGGGIGSIAVKGPAGTSQIQVGFIPILPKDSNKTLSLTVQFSLAVIP